MSGDNALTEQELQWMDELLAECRQQGVMPRHRFELASYAIVCKGDTKKAVARMAKVYKVEAEGDLDSIETLTASQVSEQISPGCFLPAGRDDLGRPICYMDYAASNPGGFKSEYQQNCLLRVTIDTFACLTTTIRDIREGSVCVSSGKGMGWKNFRLDLEQKTSQVSQDGFPIKIKSVLIVDPPIIISALLKLSRVFIKKKMADRIVTCSSEDVLSKRVGSISADQLPPHGGGSFVEAKDAWMQRCLAKRAESIKELGPI